MLIFEPMESNVENWVPWTDGIYILDCFVIKDLAIDIAKPGEQVDAPKHLILTGRNGSGKSSVLRALDLKIRWEYDDQQVVRRELFQFRLEHPSTKAKGVMYGLTSGRLSQTTNGVQIYKSELPARFGSFVYAYFPPGRNRAREFEMESSHEEEMIAGKSLAFKDVVGMEFEKFFISQKVASLFYKDEGKLQYFDFYNGILDRLTRVFRELYDDELLRFDFDARELSFSFLFEGHRKVNVRNLSDGFFSTVMILLNLYARQEAIRGENPDNIADIPGLVLIDEPELHLHLELQYRIMPILTELFPKIQFIVATHSPAVISSIRNATVYDLTKREYAPSYIAGESFSSLMESHFGLDNEFGPVADELLGKVKHIYLNGGSKQEKSTAIRVVMEKYKDIITPTLRVELESTIIHLETENTRP